MPERIAADAVVVVHFAFILFAVLGALAAYRWRWLVFLHLPAAAWAVLIEFNGWICPLTPLEQSLRRAAGEAGYSGGFVDHYLLPIIYPPGLNRSMQIGLGLFVLAFNLVVYLQLIRSIREESRAAESKRIERE